MNMHMSVYICSVNKTKAIYIMKCMCNMYFADIFHVSSYQLVNFLQSLMKC